MRIILPYILLFILFISCKKNSTEVLDNVSNTGLLKSVNNAIYFNYDSQRRVTTMIDYSHYFSFDYRGDETVPFHFRDSTFSTNTNRSRIDHYYIEYDLLERPIKDSMRSIIFDNNSNSVIQDITLPNWVRTHKYEFNYRVIENVTFSPTDTIFFTNDSNVIRSIVSWNNNSAYDRIFYHSCLTVLNPFWNLNIRKTITDVFSAGGLDARIFNTKYLPFKMSAERYPTYLNQQNEKNEFTYEILQLDSENKLLQLSIKDSVFSGYQPYGLIISDSGINAYNYY